MTHRISVIVPAYNGGRYLDTCLASVASQSRPPEEVIVVDDGSTDDTKVVARRWESVLPLVLVEKDENEGLGAARRDGILKARGDLIALIDADDYWFPDHLEVLLETYQRHGGIVAADTYTWLPGVQLSQTPWSKRSPLPADQAKEILDRNLFSVLTLFAKDDYDAAGGFRALRVDEDWDLWIRMIHRGSRVTVAPSVTAVVRIRPDSLSAADRFLEHDIAILESFASEVSVDERRLVARAIRRRRARQLLLAGYELARQRQVAPARRAWVKAALVDRSLRRPLGDGTGSVTLRALACAVAPERVVRLRDRRAADLDKRLGGAPTG